MFLKISLDQISKEAAVYRGFGKIYNYASKFVIIRINLFKFKNILQIIAILIKVVWEKYLYGISLALDTIF